jgi:rhamnose utilization protein RhaD (predicted bifunctional aldolase and dehydrogenase)
VLVLQNHGLVVGADDAGSAATLLAEVERRVAVAPRPAPPADPAWLRRRRPPGYRLPRDETCHGIATDRESLRMAAGGSLYPDHVVFLGAHATLIDPDDSPDYGAAGGGPPWLLVRGSGVLLHESLPAGGEEMVRCLVRVLPRIDPAARLVYLSRGQVAELLDWDAEKYRRQLAVGG